MEYGKFSMFDQKYKNYNTHPISTLPKAINVVHYISFRSSVDSVPI